MKKIIFLIFLTACTSKNVNNNILDFNMDLTFDEFKVLLEEYNKKRGYPDIYETMSALKGDKAGLEYLLKQLNKEGQIM